MSDTSTGGYADWITNQVDILKNIAASMAPIQKLVSGGAYLLGILFAMKALHSLKSFGESRTMMSGNASFKEPLAYILVAAMLIYLPTGFDILMNSSFGNSTILAYADSDNTALNTLFGQNSSVGASLTLIIQTLGLIAFVRGWVLIAKSASQGQPPGGTGKGLIHVFGGILAMNIVGTLEIINNTIYGV